MVQLLTVYSIGSVIAFAWSEFSSVDGLWAKITGANVRLKANLAKAGLAMNGDGQIVWIDHTYDPVSELGIWGSLLPLLLSWAYVVMRLKVPKTTRQVRMNETLQILSSRTAFSSEETLALVKASFAIPDKSEKK